MSTFGNNLKISIFGASHEKFIGLTIHNFPEGIIIDQNRITDKLRLRRGLNYLTSKRFEEDNFEFISGVFENHTTGSPITILINNSDIKSEDYQKIYGVARPSHADYTYYKKYHGFNDYRGGGTSSGRLTVALVALGAICEQILEDKGIIISSRINKIEKLIDDDFEVDQVVLKKLQKEVFPVFNDDVKRKMLKRIEEVRAENDSLGGVVETYITNLPVGLGEPFFDSFESIISHLIFSIPGVKGIEFGRGFEITDLLGSSANDPIRIIDGKVSFEKNNSGGINGGITNGDLVVFRTAFKPTASISKTQDTINFIKNTNEILEVNGRHDAIIAIKGLHVVNALTNYAVLEMMLGNKNE